MKKVKQSKSTAHRIYNFKKEYIRRATIMGIRGGERTRQDTTRPIEFSVQYADYDQLNDNIRLEKDASVIFNWMLSLPHGTVTRVFDKIISLRKG